MPARYLQPRKAWLAIAGYELLGALAARVMGISLTFGASWPLRDGLLRASSIPYALAMVSTGFCAVVYARGSTRLGRSWNPLVSVAFAAANGMCETMFFLASFDLGRALAPGLPVLGVALGYLSFLVYSALIHVHFWDPCVLPPHIPKAEKKAEKIWKISNLAFSSSWWLVLYGVYGDVLTPCLLHCFLNAVGDWSFCLPPPWARYRYASAASALDDVCQAVAPRPSESLAAAATEE